jgi:hypothetical protein
MRLPDLLRTELEDCGLPWAVEDGGKHYLLKIQGRLAAALPKGGKTRKQECNLRSVLNIRSQVRRMVNDMKCEMKGELKS